MPSGGRRPGAGQPRKSAEEKAAAGTLRPGREAEYRVRDAARLTLEPCPVPSPPDDLTDAERRWWELLAPAVDEVGMFTAPDVHVFRLLVEKRALLQAAKTGEFVEAAQDGGTKPVGVAGLVALTKSTHGLMVRFGLDPASRGKVLAVRAEESDEKRDDPDDMKPLALRVVP